MKRKLVRYVLAMGLLLTVSVGLNTVSANDDVTVDSLVAYVKSHGADPLEFSLNALKKHDLIIFDDALHNAVEPFGFYQDLIADKRFSTAATIIFFEIFTMDSQPALDAYLNAKEEDITLLYPAFHLAAFNGWRYRTYLEIMKSIRHANLNAPVGSPMLRAVGVSPPSYWSEIETPADFKLYDESNFWARDHFMYRAIIAELDAIEGTKGIFLTNTRHAYTGLRDRAGKLMWNTGTFFSQWQPERTISVRFNAPFLNITKQKKKTEGLATSQGLEKVVYSWSRAHGGMWDRAFAKAGNEPVAVLLKGSPFGQAPYIGNRMLQARSGQTMADVNDAVIHLKPIKNWHQSAIFHQIYTPAFKTEIARRYKAAYSPDELKQFLSKQKMSSLEEFANMLAESAPQKLNSISQSLADTN